MILFLLGSLLRLLLNRLTQSRFVLQNPLDGSTDCGYVSGHREKHISFNFTSVAKSKLLTSCCWCFLFRKGNGSPGSETQGSQHGNDFEDERNMCV